MFLLDAAGHHAGSAAPPDLVFSASDLVAASECEYRTLRILDEKLGRTPKAEFPVDEMQKRAGELGDRHEQTVLASLVAKYGQWDAGRGSGVYSLDRGQNLRGELQAKHAETELALRSGADVVFQATFFDGEFLGYADFLVHEAAGTGNPGRYEVWDTKLARHAKWGPCCSWLPTATSSSIWGWIPPPPSHWSSAPASATIGCGAAIPCRTCCPFSLNDGGASAN